MTGAGLKDPCRRERCVDRRRSGALCAMFRF